MSHAIDHEPQRLLMHAFGIPLLVALPQDQQNTLIDEHQRHNQGINDVSQYLTAAKAHQAVIRNEKLNQQLPGCCRIACAVHVNNRTVGCLGITCQGTHQIT